MKRPRRRRAVLVPFWVVSRKGYNPIYPLNLYPPLESEQTGRSEVSSREEAEQGVSGTPPKEPEPEPPKESLPPPEGEAETSPVNKVEQQEVTPAEPAIQKHIDQFDLALATPLEQDVDPPLMTTAAMEARKMVSSGVAPRLSS